LPLPGKRFETRSRPERKKEEREDLLEKKKRALRAPALDTTHSSAWSLLPLFDRSKSAGKPDALQTLRAIATRVSRDFAKP
jgi:hypothetical protein